VSTHSVAARIDIVRKTVLATKEFKGKNIVWNFAKRNNNLGH
jgi:hypothetical protein